MANLNAALRRVRQTRKNRNADSTSRFERVRPEYEAVLRELEALGGDPAFDDLTEWLVETVKRNRRLPEPEAVRQRAREICVERGIDIPEHSSLRR